MSSTGAGSTPTKAELRGSLLAARAARPAADLSAARAALAALALARAGSLACVAAYEPLRTEPGSVELLDGLARAGVRVLTPVLLSDRDLAWESWPSSPSSEPAEPAGIGAAELLFVPALAVDRSGNRLGRGGGSYDRALGRVAPSTPIVALVFDDEVLPWVPTDPWDRPVTAALTPSGWVWFGPVAGPAAGAEAGAE
jgi:5-formyltetrahydrofolate cyclo-ligase